MTLEISDIVRVTATISPQGVLRREFGIPLFLTTDTTLPTGPGRVGTFADFDAISATFDETTEPFAAGNIYFQQAPFPKNLVIGRWIDADAPAIVRGGLQESTLGDYQAISDGSLQINGVDVTGIDLTGVTAFADVAAALQAGLVASGVADLATAEVVFDPINQSFNISTGATVGAAITLTTATVAGAGTDLSSLMSLDDASGAVVFQQGADAESIEDALEAIGALNDQWYFITNDKTINDTATVQALSAYAAAGSFQYANETNDPQVIVTGDTTSIVAQIAALEPERTFSTWSETADYKALSCVARFSSVNFNANNSIITGKFKELPGTLADDITTTIQTELERKRVNYYAPFTGDNIYAEGYNHRPGVFTDVRYWLDWFVNAVQVDVYNLLRQSNRVPLTRAGINAVRNVIEQTCQQGVRNGGIAPGQLSSALTLDVQQTTLNTDFDGFLPKGFLIHIGSLADLSQNDRNQRISPPVKIWLKGSGAIHFIDIDVLFEN